MPPHLLHVLPNAGQLAFSFLWERPQNRQSLITGIIAACFTHLSGLRFNACLRLRSTLFTLSEDEAVERIWFDCTCDASNDRQI